MPAETKPNTPLILKLVAQNGENFLWKLMLYKLRW